jgi:Zinc finger, C3HC4 type (RING finger)
VEAKRERIRDETAQAEGEGVADDNDGFAAKSECIICMERSRNAVFPCGHVCACYLCSLQCDSCPVCRKKGEPMKLFMT